MTTDVVRPTRPLWPARPVRRRGPVLRTTLTLLSWLGQVGVWYGTIVVLLVVVIDLAVASRTANTVSVLWFARQSGIWFPFSVLIGLASSYPQVHVASGMTRRSYVRGALIGTVVVGVVLAVAMWCGLLAERAWFEAMGWRWQLQEGWIMPGDGLGAVLVAYVSLFVVGALSGLLVGTVYTVAGAWWGTLTIPLTVGPILAVTVLTDAPADWLPFAGSLGLAAGDRLPPVGVAAGSAVLAALLAAAFRVLASRRAIAPRRG